MYNTGKNTGMNPHQTQFVLLQSSQKILIVNRLLTKLKLTVWNCEEGKQRTEHDEKR